VEKNDELKLNIDSLGAFGEGVGKVEGKTVFVKGALPGEVVTAKVIFNKPSFCHTKLLTCEQSSTDRVEPRCPVFLKCGGCDVQHLRYNKQLEFKRQLVSDALERIGKLSVTVNECVASEKIWGYRNKMSLPVRRENGKTKIGLFAPNSHRVVEVKDCLLQPKWNAKIISLLYDYIDSSRYRAYDEESGKGEIRHIVVRETSGCLFVTVVTTKVIDLKGFFARLRAEFKSFALYQNVNDKRNNVILGDVWRYEGGENVPEEVEGYKFSIHPGGFFQVNDGVRKALYAAIEDAVKNSGADVVVDAYSGAGLLTARLKENVKRAYGVEINRNAHESAVRLVKDNGLTDVFPILGDVKDKIGDILDAETGAAVCVVLDPPRAGCDGAVMRAIAKAKPASLIYVSCNPATLARDLNLIRDEYDVVSVTPFDMFPHTAEVETLVCLTLKE
jgi:23S rRNA (uracil1939-C5)-methyltransferase